MPGLSSEQETMSRVYNTAATLVPEVGKIAGATVQNLADAVLHSAALCLKADFRYREAERLEGMGLDVQRALAARRTADRYNTAVIESLTESLPRAIDQVRREFQELNVDARDALLLYEEMGLEEIAATDIKGTHAATGAKIVRDGVALASEAGIAGICNELDAHVARLADIRRERPHQNDPVTATIGAIMNFVGTVGLIVCLSTGSCSPAALTTFFDLWFIGGMVFIVSLLVTLATL